jgi:TonB family protein
LVGSALVAAEREGEQKKRHANHEAARDEVPESTPPYVPDTLPREMQASVDQSRQSSTATDAGTIWEKTDSKLVWFIVLGLVFCTLTIMLAITRSPVKRNPRPQEPSQQNQEPSRIAKNSGVEERTQQESAQAVGEAASRREPHRAGNVEGAAERGAGPNIAPNLVIGPAVSVGRTPSSTKPTTIQTPEVVIPPVVSISVNEGKTTTTHLLDASTAMPKLAKPQRPLRASEVISGHAISQPLPPYPEQALRSGVQGSVILHGVIAADGSVKNLRVLDGHAVLGHAAIDAVKKWRYEITYIDRVPAERDFIEEINFSLRGSPHVTLPLDFPKGMIGGRPISQPSPTYPEQALHWGIQGKVILHGIIGADGVVRNLRVLEGNPLLAQSAADEVKTWRYEPSRRDGVRIERPFMVIVNFRK